MKLNENTVIKGQRVVLVPYEKSHVPRYHNWMQSKELQILTASEPLSLEDEYKMQNSWRTDPDIKYPIVLTPIAFQYEFESIKNEVNAMIGDTNIFLQTDSEEICGEIEIMIAEKSARGKGFGKEAVLLMLRYGIEELNINMYEAKVNSENNSSISLFTKIGFEKVNENKVFQEYVFQRKVTDSWKEWLTSQTNFYVKENR